MDNAFEHVYANFISSESKNPSQLGGVGVTYYSIDTAFQLDHYSTDSTPSFLSSSETKRKWRVVNEEIEQEPLINLDLNISLSLGLYRKKNPCVAPIALGAENLNLELGSNVHNVEMPVIPSTTQLVPPLKNLKNPEAPTALFDNFLSHNDPSQALLTFSFVMPKKSPVARALKAIPRPRQSYTSTVNICRVEGCTKRARGASGRCIFHGGGRRCQKTGCDRGANDGSIFCKAHGGGRRCQYLGCIKSAEGRTDYCIAHGGGKRCSFEGCSHAAKGKSSFCIKHGGGRRCQMENCTKSAEGSTNYCIKHGGGRRCQHPTCTKGAQGSTMFCKAHGGGKRCMHPGCTKGAEGSTSLCKAHGGGKKCMCEGGGVCLKIVYGAARLCYRHGGGKRCAMPNCTKSARGSTKYCIRHGGGKRCAYEGCGKSVKSSHDFCKPHGGWKKCSWGDIGLIFAAQGISPCNTVAIKDTSLCAVHTAKVEEIGSSNPFPTMQFPVSSTFKVVHVLENSSSVYMKAAGNIGGC